MQEPLDELPPGQIPAYSDIIFTGNIVDSVRRGDKAVITGIFRAYAPEQKRSSAGWVPAFLRRCCYWCPHRYAT